MAAASTRVLIGLSSFVAFCGLFSLFLSGVWAGKRRNTMMRSTAICVAVRAVLRVTDSAPFAFGVEFDLSVAQAVRRDLVLRLCTDIGVN